MQQDYLEEFTEAQLEILVKAAQDEIVPRFDKLLESSDSFEILRQGMIEDSGNHNVYVVLLHYDSRGVRSRTKRLGQEHMPRVYVGLTGHSPEERFRNHKKGYKHSEHVQDYGLALLPYFHENYCCLPYKMALRVESELADALHELGCTVFGGR